MLLNLCKARTLGEIKGAIELIPTALEAEKIRMPTMRPEVRLVMREGVEGGLITQSEYLIANAAAEMKVPKRVTNMHLSTLSVTEASRF